MKIILYMSVIFIIIITSTLPVAAGSDFLCAVVIEIPQIECNALVALYNSTNGPGWINSTNWLLTNTPSDWFGVTVTDGYVYVASINMHANHLHGTIPPELGNLVNLQILNLSSNGLSGSLPPEMGDLSNLLDLELQSNDLTGNIPPELGNLTNLSDIDLSGNQVSGSIPHEFGNLTNLWDLYLDNNLLSGIIPPELGSLTNLRNMYLNENKLSGIIPVELSNLTYLETLDLSLNRLTGSIPPEIGNLTNLTHLYLGGNGLNGCIPTELGNLVSLVRLYVYNNALEGEVPSSITNLVHLPNWIGTDLGFNALSSSDPDVINFLGFKDNDWRDTQTVPPNDLQATSIYTDAIELAWTPIRYKIHGGYYEVSYATMEAGPYTVHGTTKNKYYNGYVVDVLLPGVDYYLRVRTFTPVHPPQWNNLWSSYTLPFLATTRGSIVHADFSAAPTDGVAPLEVTFSNQSTGDFDTSLWDFGDGYSSTLASPTHSYTTANVYTVSLKVSGLSGTDSETKESYISVEFQKHFLPVIHR